MTFSLSLWMIHCSLLHIMTYYESERNFQFFPTHSFICDLTYKNSLTFPIIYMSFEETDTEESGSSLSELSFLDDDLDRMHVESGSADEEISDDEMSSNVWKEIESESDEEFMEDHGLVEEVTSAPEDHMVNPIDCYRHFITDEIIDLMVRETNRYAEQYLQTHEISRQSKFLSMETNH